ncbi:AEC family transporter [Plasticicumulans sp.]|uniref:AEC family transporter n=1 Tax=Plasticicumulans sp. TaxID=2307179 RepID=UPI002BB1FC8B|nr:AEC family transporter [Plasticicumulans sp.]MBS0600030.1 AEC family transporter [Pseudomonadota bacterium]HMW28816.1 AEC family transporter [Plasticicumulans sp.]HMW41766.1 AEC family transporter [Plasticicumulans sp.]HMX53765.1 AEC family transporter [Plasticicumulans sp.]HMZ11114.1 AEC family transporter [Plasticicumulans sp.]
MIELLLRIGGIVFPVFAIAAVGALWGRRHRPDMSVVNRLNVEVFAPALVFWALADKPLDFDLYRDLAIGGIAVVLGSGLLLWPFVRLAGIDARTFIPPMMFNNSGNMGIPLALFAFGETALQAAVVLFIIEMVLHFTVGLYILDHRTRPWRLLKMPMIQATIAGLACSAFGLTLPAPLANTIKLMGQVSIPLLLFALGVRLLDVNLRDWKLGTAGAFAGPLAGVASLWLVLPWLSLDEAQFPQLLIFAALPPAVLNVLVAEQYRQEPERVASIVLIGNLGSLVVLPAALWFALPH